MHGINWACHLIIAVTIGDMMFRSNRLLHVGHIFVLDEVDNFHNLSKILVFSESTRDIIYMALIWLFN
jgi:hypothetical protein